MRKRSNRNAWKTIAVALLLAVAVHMQLLMSDLLPAMVRFWNSLFPRPAVEQSTEVTLVAMTPSQFAQNRQVTPDTKVEEQPAEEEKLAVQEPEEDKPDNPEGQVVDVAPTPDSSRPKDAKFLSEHNTNVEKETVSRDQRADYGIAQPRPTLADSTNKRPDKPQEQDGADRVALVTRRRGASESAPAERMFSFEIPDMKKRDSLNLKLDLAMGDLATYQASDELRGNSDRLQLQDGKPGAASESEAGERGEDDRTVAMFKRPSLDQLDMVTGAPANDHIEDIAKGEATLLNSREFKFATFFNRVKRGVSQHWSPRVSEEYLRRDPYGNIYGVKDRRTLLNISLDAEGALTKVSVVRSSGVQFFDDVAIQSFRDASPFPNPPNGLVETDGSIRFQFGFYFMIGERPAMRAFQFQRRPF